MWFIMLFVTMAAGCWVSDLYICSNISLPFVEIDTNRYLRIRNASMTCGYWPTSGWKVDVSLGIPFDVDECSVFLHDEPKNFICPLLEDMFRKNILNPVIGQLQYYDMLTMRDSSVPMVDSLWRSMISAYIPDHIDIDMFRVSGLASVQYHNGTLKWAEWQVDTEHVRMRLGNVTLRPYFTMDKDRIVWYDSLLDFSIKEVTFGDQCPVPSSVVRYSWGLLDHYYPLYRALVHLWIDPIMHRINVVLGQIPVLVWPDDRMVLNPVVIPALCFLAVNIIVGGVIIFLGARGVLNLWRAIYLAFHFLLVNAAQMSPLVSLIVMDGDHVSYIRTFSWYHFVFYSIQERTYALTSGIIAWMIFSHVKPLLFPKWGMMEVFLIALTSALSFSHRNMHVHIVPEMGFYFSLFATLIALRPFVQNKYLYCRLALFLLFLSGLFLYPNAIIIKWMLSTYYPSTGIIVILVILLSVVNCEFHYFLYPVLCILYWMQSLPFCMGMWVLSVHFFIHCAFQLGSIVWIRCRRPRVEQEEELMKEMTVLSMGSQ
jgi:hypothetical protein